MSIILRPETEKLLERQLEKSGYSSVDELVRAGVAALELHGDFMPGEMDRLLAEGEADIAAGRVVDGEGYHAKGML
jgi:Arc/MetJ-type ribon-helix-helix transcriptional regulator